MRARGGEGVDLFCPGPRLPWLYNISTKKWLDKEEVWLSYAEVEDFCLRPRAAKVSAEGRSRWDEPGLCIACPSEIRVVIWCTIWSFFSWALVRFLYHLSPRAEKKRSPRVFFVWSVCVCVCLLGLLLSSFSVERRSCSRFARDCQNLRAQRVGGDAGSNDRAVLLRGTMFK